MGNLYLENFREKIKNVHKRPPVDENKLFVPVVHKRPPVDGNVPFSRTMIERP